jgi:hypothetical protein
MEATSDEFVPPYLLHRLNRIRNIPNAAAHPFQNVSAEKFATPELPNQIIEDAEENREFRTAASLQPSLHWGTAVRAAPVIPSQLGLGSGKSSAVVHARKKSDSDLQRARERPASEGSSLYTTLPAVVAVDAHEGVAQRINQNVEALAITRTTSAVVVQENTTTKHSSLKPRNQSDLEPKANATNQQAQFADDFDGTGVMAAWISHRKAFDTGSISWDLQMPLYSQELVEHFTTDKFKQKRPGVVADIRARAVQQKVKSIGKSTQANKKSDEEELELRERLEIMKRNKKAMDLRLGRLIVEEDDKADSTVFTAPPRKTGTKTNAELEYEALQSRTIQAAREHRRELALASSSRLRPHGHVYQETKSLESSKAELELRLEALRYYNLKIVSRDAYCEQLQEALKSTYYFAAGNTQEKDFFVYALQNCGIKESYILDANGCSLSQVAGSGFGLMMGTPMNQLTALHARDILIPSSSWRFMCDGLRLSRTLALLDISFARGAPQSSEGMKNFSLAIKKNVSLIELIAQGLPLGIPENANVLADAIGTHIRLRKLDFSECSITDYSMNVRLASYFNQP